MNAPTLTLGDYGDQEPENAEDEAQDDSGEDAASDAAGTDADSGDEGSDAVSVGSSPPSPPDSQVSSGWHGKAIMFYNSLERREKEMAQERDRRLLPVVKVVTSKNTV